MNATNLTCVTRRAFVEQTAAAAAIAAVSGRAVAAPTNEPQAASPTKAVSPNSRIRVGLLGCGGMGRSNLANCAKFPDVVVTAACDVQQARREAVVAQYKDTCKPYSDFRQMLASTDLDAVIVATPPHWHALHAIAVCEAGKDLYLQKPMTLHLGESLAVRNAVRRHKRVCQVGTQIHAGEGYRRAVEFIRSGNLGSIGVVRTFNVMNQGPEGIGHSKAPAQPPKGIDWEMWVGPAPMRPFNDLLVANAYNHGSWMDYSGGWTPGMAPHIIDLPIWALDLGYPLSVSSTGGRYIIDDDGDAYDHHEVCWRYPKMTLTWMSSLTNSYGFDLHGDAVPKRRLGIYFHGTNGTMYANYSMFKIVPEGKKMDGLEAPPKSIAPSPGHEREWLDCIVSRQTPSCSPEYHLKIDVPIVLSLLSLKLGRSVRFDPANESIVGDPEAAKLAVPEYRLPWKFPMEYLTA